MLKIAKGSCPPREESCIPSVSALLVTSIYSMGCLSIEREDTGTHVSVLCLRINRLVSFHAARRGGGKLWERDSECLTETDSSRGRCE